MYLLVLAAAMVGLTAYDEYFPLVARDHGVATATACALLDLECVVYMGAEDIRRQAPNVQRMGLLGAEVVSVDAGARTNGQISSATARQFAVAFSSPSSANRPRLMRCKIT